MKRKYTYLFTILLFIGVGFISNTAAQSGGCPSSVSNNTVSADGTVTFCGSGSVSFTGSTPDITIAADTSYQWQSKTLSGSWTNVSGTNRDYSAGTLTETTSFRRLVVIKDCANEYSSNTIEIVINTTPSAPTNGQPAEICFGDANTAISASVQAGETIDWYAGATAGTPLLSGNTSYTSSETADGVYTYYAEARNTTSDCVSNSRLAVTYTIKANPTLSLTSATCAADFLTYDIVFESNGTVTSSAGIVNNTAKTVSGITAGTDVTLTATLNGCTTDLPVTAPTCSCPTINTPTNGQPAEICFGDANTAIFASVQAGETIDWYAGPTGGTPLSSGSLSYISSETAAGVYTYYAEARNTTSDCVSSSRLAITYTIKANPTLSLTSATCAADFLTYDIVFESNGTVTSSAGIVNNTAKTVSGITAGTDVTLTATLNGCTTDLPVTAPTCSCPTINTPTNGQPAEICFGDANIAISASVQAGETIDWYAGATAGTPLLSGNTSYTSSETADGVYTYYAEARNTTSDCVSNSRLAVTYTIKANPTLSLTSATCAADFLTYDIVFESNGTVTSSAGIVNNTAKTVSGITAGTDVTLTATLNGCTTDLPVTAPTCSCPTINTPTNGQPAEICFGDANIAISASVQAGETIDWYAGATGGTPLLSGSTSYTSSETAAGVYTYYAEARNTTSNCVSSSRLAVTYTIKANPTLSLTSATCAADFLTYDIVFESNGTVTSTAGNVNNTAKTVSGITAGTDVTLTATLNGCTTDLPVTAPTCSCPTINTPTDGQPAEICFGDANIAISASVQEGETIDWYAGPTGGTPLSSGSLSYISSETAAGVYTYYVEARNTTSDCVSSSRLAITYTIKANPTLSLTSATCAADLLTYDIVFESNGTVTSSAGIVNNTAKTVSGITAGTDVTLTATLNGCTTDLPVTAPTCSCPTINTPTNGQPAEICFGDANIAISASVQAGETIDWYAGATAGTPLLSGNTSYTSSETADGVYTYYAEARNTTSDCVSNSRLAVTYTIKANPTLSLTSATCAADFLTYDIVFESNGTVTSSAGIVNNTAKTVSGITAGTDVTLTATLNGCTTDLPVTAPTCSCPTINTPTNGQPAEICFGDANIAISASVQAGETIDWYAGATGGTPLLSGSTSYTSSETAAGVYTYYAEARNTTSNCVSSSRLAVTYTIISKPVITNVTAINPTICQGLGSLNFTFTGVTNGTYDIAYDGNSFTNVNVSGNFASVAASAGTYNNLKITANGCTSANGVNASLSDPNPPSTPTISVQDNCGQSVLTASNYTGTLNWSTGESTESIIVNTAGNYSLTQILNGCTSDAATATATPKTIPSIDNVTEVNPQECLGQGSLNFAFSGVPDGTYNITYDDGSFANIAISNNETTISAPSGIYNNLIITLNGCSSANGVNASLSDPIPPSAPTITVENNCGESVLTASDYTGTLLWNTGEITESITVNTSGNYSVTQTLNGCTSDVTTATATPKTIPTIAGITENDPTVCQGQGSLQFAFTDVPNGLYTIAYDGNSFSNVAISGNETLVFAAAGTYNNLKITVDGCTSANGINASLSDPNPPPTPTISIQNNCGQSILTASNYSGTLNWSTAENTESIVVNTAGNYSLTQTLNGCTSDAATATATPKIIPGIDNVTVIAPQVCQGQGSLSFSFSGVPNGTYNITYDGNSFSNVLVSNNSANVQTSAGTYNNLKITVNGCTSANGINATVSEPNPPPVPTITVQNNCGESVLTALYYTGTLSWSTGETTESIIVNNAGNYSVTQTINGCTSNAATIVAAPKTIPVITSVVETDPNVCQGQGLLQFTFSNVPNGTYTISYDGNSFNNVTVSNSTATVLAPARTYNNLKITVNGCTSASGVNASLSDPNPPPTPGIMVENYCGNSVLTATNYTGSLIWDTGETTESITVYTARDYTLSQIVNGCMSDAAVATANPEKSSLVPDLEVIDKCGESEISVNNLLDDALLYWQFNNTMDSTQENSFTVYEKGEYTIYQKQGTCSSLDAIITANPLAMPSPPVGNDKEICATESVQTLNAEATSTEENTEVVWFDSPIGGNEIPTPSLNTEGSVTYYAESQNTATGCISNSRTPVTLTIKPNPKTAFLDTTIIGKPRGNVAVLIFPNNSQKYQWYLNENEITNATQQYYYINESERITGNTFVVEVELENGCKAKFNYPYSSNSTENEFNAFKSSIFNEDINFFSIYPNPVKNDLKISVNSNELFKTKKLNVKIFSISGACVLESTLDQNPKNIDIKHIRPGFYSVAIYGAGNRLVTKKLVVTKH